MKALKALEWMKKGKRRRREAKMYLVFINLPEADIKLLLPVIFDTHLDTK